MQDSLKKWNNRLLCLNYSSNVVLYVLLVFPYIVSMHQGTFYVTFMCFYCQCLKGLHHNLKEQQIFPDNLCCL